MSYVLIVLVNKYMVCYIRVCTW